MCYSIWESSACISHNHREIFITFKSARAFNSSSRFFLNESLCFLSASIELINCFSYSSEISTPIIRNSFTAHNLSTEYFFEYPQTMLSPSYVFIQFLAELSLYSLLGVFFIESNQTVLWVKLSNS